MFKSILLLSLLVSLNQIGIESKDEFNQDHDDDVMTYVLNTTKYKKQIRPAKLISVNFTLTYVRIAALDEKIGMLSSSFYMSANWFDFRLKWNRTMFELTELFIPASSIWIPDLAVINAVNHVYFFYLRLTYD